MNNIFFSTRKWILALFAVAAASIFLFITPAFAYDSPGPVILSQPLDVSINYPEGATFSVEVQDPENVSYQWFFVDEIGQEFILDGTSAFTDTLIIPSTEASFDTCEVYCIVTDGAGNQTESDHAVITIENYFDEITVLYVESYALLPGQSIDLGEVNLGSGTIGFDTDGEMITFENVNFDNEEVIWDHTVSPGIGIMYRGYHNDYETLTLNLQGENSFLNRFYQESSNGSGIPIDFYCLGEGADTPAELLICGDGTLTVQGGTYLIRNNGKITVDADLTLLQYEGHYCDGIVAESTVADAEITICPGTHIHADINGAAIFSSTGITVQKGCELNIHSSAPLVGAGDTSKHVLYSRNISIHGATVNIDMESDPERFLPAGSAVGTFTAIAVPKYGGININDSTVNIHVTDGKSGIAGYTYYNCGITSGTDSNLLIKNSDIEIIIDGKDAINAEGIRISGKADIIDSSLKINCQTIGLVHGLYCRDAINLKDSTVDVLVNAFDYSEGKRRMEGNAHGILSNERIDVSLKEGQHIKAVSKKGISLGVDYLSGQTEVAGYDKAYEPQYITLEKDCEIVLPENSVLNRTSRLSGQKYIYTETPYNSKNTASIEDTTLIQPKKAVPKTGDSSAVPWLLFAGIALAIGVLCKKRLAK